MDISTLVISDIDRFVEMKEFLENKLQKQLI